MDYYCPEWVLTARQPRGGEYHRAKNSAMLCSPCSAGFRSGLKGGWASSGGLIVPSMKAWAGISGG